MDNVFRFVQAGSEVSSLLDVCLARWLSADARHEVASLQERIASVAGAAVTAIQAVYVRRRLHGSAVTAISSHMDSIIMLSHASAEVSTQPSIRSPHHPCCLTPCGGEEHYRIAERAAKHSPASKTSKTSSLSSVWRSSVRTTGSSLSGPRLQRFLSQPFTVTEAFTGTPAAASVVPIRSRAARHPRRRGRQLGGKFLYMIGTLDEARQKEAAAVKTEGVS